MLSVLLTPFSVISILVMGKPRVYFHRLVFVTLILYNLPSITKDLLSFHRLAQLLMVQGQFCGDTILYNTPTPNSWAINICKILCYAAHIANLFSMISTQMVGKPQFIFIVLSYIMLILYNLPSKTKDLLSFYALVLFYVRLN